MNPEEFQDIATWRFKHQVAKKNIKQQIQSRLNVTHNNGFFTVTKELICFLSCWDEDTLVLEDDYETPILVNRQELLKLTKQRYCELMNEWNDEWQNLKKVRTARNV